jgi:hypothetical protein
LQDHISKLMNACAIGRDKRKMSLRMISFYPCPKLLANVHDPTINE